MTRFRLLLLASFISPQLLLADPDLDRLRASYEAALERAAAPVRRSYEAELRKLMDRQTKAAKLDAALATKAELEKLADKPGAAADGEAVHVTGAKAMEPLFIDKTWQTPAGSNFTFRKDGTCLRQFNTTQAVVKWRTHGPNAIEVIGSTPAETRYFRFVSPTEAYYGEKDSITTPVRPQ